MLFTIMIRFLGKSLQRKFLTIIIGSYVVVSAVTLGIFFTSLDSIARRLGKDFAMQYVLKEKAAISAPINREIALARKLADTPLLKKWAIHESDTTLSHDALAELENFRSHFRDGSYFFVVNESGHYYYNDAAGTYNGKELRYTLDSAEKNDQWYFSTIRKVRDFALNVNYDKDIRETKIWINVLVRDKDAVLGLAGTGLSLGTFIHDFIANHPTGVVPMLLDKEGAIQAHPDTRFIDQSSISKSESEKSTVFRFLKSEGDRHALRSVLDRLGSGSAEAESFWLDTGAGQRICAVAAIPEIGWFVLIFFDHRQVAGLSMFMPMVNAVVLSLLVLASLILFALRRIVLKPILELTASTKLFSEGRKSEALPIRSSDEIGILTGAFNAMTETIRGYTEELEAKVKQRTADLQTLLDNTGEGILSFGKDLCVDPKCSRECESLLGVAPAGRRIDELLYPKAPAGAALFRSAVERSFETDDGYKRNMLLSLIPAEITVGDKIIALRFRSLGGSRMMLMLNDVTYKRELEKKVTAEQRTLRFIVNALTNRWLFHEVMEAWKRFADIDAPSVIAKTGTDSREKTLLELYRQVHTFKGLFLQLELVHAPGILHECEERLTTFQNGCSDAHLLDEFRRLLTGALDLPVLMQAVEEDRKILARYLGPAFFSKEEPYTLDPEDLTALELLADKINSSPETVRRLELEEELIAIRRLRTVRVFDLVSAFPAHAQELAELRGKLIRPFAPYGDNVRVLREKYEAFTMSLIHLFRNAVVHGIEDPETRVRKGKDEAGTLTFEVTYTGEELVFRIADDGGGIDLDALRKKIEERSFSMSACNKPVVASALEDILFCGGVSTKARVDLHGGRGVGLVAVRKETERLGGSIRVKTEKDVGTEFIIAVPDKEVYR